MQTARKRDSFLRDKVFLSSLTRLSLPMAVQSLMLAAVAAADALMLGGVNQNAMAAVSLASQIQFLQNMFVSAFVVTMSILAAQYWGKGERDTVSRLYFMSLKLSTAVSLLFFAACEFMPRTLMLIYTDNEELIPIGCSYLRLAGWSYLMTGISQSALTLLKVTDHTRQSAVISSTTVVLNIILNAVFIFGLRMDVRGAALATLIARTLEMLWSVGLQLCKGYQRPSFARHLRASAVLWRSYIKAGAPLLGASVLWCAGFSSYSSFMGHMGGDATAANSITAVVRDLVCCLCNGLATGGGILVGNELGAGHLDTGKLYGERLLRLGWWVGLLSTVIMLAFTPLLLTFVKLADAARTYFVQMMLVMAVYMIGRVLNSIVINGVMAAGGDTAFDLYSLAVTMWGIAIPLAALGTYVFHWPVWVVYACTCLDEVGKIPWVLIHFRKYKWVRDLTVKDGETV